MGVIKMRKRPVEVEAILFSGGYDPELAEFVGEMGYFSNYYQHEKWTIQTLHGQVIAEVGDWIIRGPKGDFWPIKNEIFIDSYENTDNPTSQDCYERGYREGYEDGLSALEA